MKHNSQVQREYSPRTMDWKQNLTQKVSLEPHSQCYKTATKMNCSGNECMVNPWCHYENTG